MFWPIEQEFLKKKETNKQKTPKSKYPSIEKVSCIFCKEILVYKYGGYPSEWTILAITTGSYLLLNLSAWPKLDQLHFILTSLTSTQVIMIPFLISPKI